MVENNYGIHDFVGSGVCGHDGEMVMAGVHHAYLGLFLMLIGFLAIWVFYPSAILIIIGIFVFLDDAYQHLRQRSNPEYASPLHRLFVAHFWKYIWVQAITRWFDNIFGV